jgi:hypothetical protein
MSAGLCQRNPIRFHSRNSSLEVKYRRVFLSVDSFRLLQRLPPASCGEMFRNCNASERVQLLAQAYKRLVIEPIVRTDQTSAFLNAKSVCRCARHCEGV